MRSWSAVLTVLLVMPVGCASPRPPSLDLHLALQRQRIALVPATSELESSVELFARSRFEGALKGVGAGALSGVGMLGHSSCSGEICGAVLVAALAIAVVTGSAIGAVTGAIEATPQEKADEIERVFERTLKEFPAHLDLSRRVLEAAQHEAGVALELGLPAAPAAAGRGDVRALRSLGFDSALEVGIRRIAFTGGRGTDPELALEIEAGARLVETATGEIAYEREFHRIGAPRRFSAWIAEGGESLRQEFSSSLEVLAENVAEAFLVQVDLGISGGSGWELPGMHGFGVCWLVPVYPRNELPFMSAELRWIPVSSSRLQLRWEPFPSDRQRSKLERKSGGRKLGEIRYDLRIWEVREQERSELVYERRGLLEPEHTLEQPLMPAHRYFWSARACFALGEGTACTPWASSLVPSRGGRSCDSTEIPDSNYFRFETR